MENTLPFNITRYLCGQWTEKSFFAYILINEKGFLVDWNDTIQPFYGLQLNKQQPASEQLIFLQGFLPYQDNEPFVLDAVNFATDRSANIHIVPSGDELCILLFDVTETSKLRQDLQQSRNEIHLLYEQEIRSMRTLKKSYNELQRQKELAERANQSKSEFLQHITHDLKTPLNGVLGFAQLLEMSDTPLDESQQEYVQEIKNSGEYLLTLINGLLDVSIIESGKVKIKPERINVANLIEENIDLLKPLASKNKVSFFSRLDINSLEVWADPLRLKQIIINLLSNAIKYNQTDSCIIISSYMTSANSLRINIRDTGIGIETNQLDEIFEAFERGLAEYSEVEGTGVGLGVCKQLAELMQGSIDVYSDVGLGSLFWVELPVNEKPLKQVANKIDVQNILYVENQSVNVELMKHLLEQCSHYNLLNIPDEEGMLQEINQHTVSVIILSAEFENYLDIFQSLQQNEKSKDIPVVVLFDKSTPSVQIKAALEVGFYDYLIKPFDFNFAMELFNRLAFVAAKH